LTHGYIGEDNALQPVQRMTVRATESWIRHNANLIIRTAGHGSCAVWLLQ